LTGRTPLNRADHQAPKQARQRPIAKQTGELASLTKAPYVPLLSPIKVSLQRAHAITTLATFAPHASAMNRAALRDVNRMHISPVSGSTTTHQITSPRFMA
jgi:hypothetical protein